MSGRFLKSLTSHLASMKDGDPLGEVQNLFGSLVQEDRPESELLKLDNNLSQINQQQSCFGGLSDKNSVFMDFTLSNIFGQPNISFFDRQESSFLGQFKKADFPDVSRQISSDMNLSKNQTRGQLNFQRANPLQEEMNLSKIDTQQHSLENSKLLNFSGFQNQTSSMEACCQIQSLLHNSVLDRNREKKKLPLSKIKSLRKRPSRQALVRIEDKKGTQREISRAKVRCICRKTKCLKLYCICFKNGLNCSEFCSCKDCENVDKKETELKLRYRKKVLHNTRKKPEKNPEQNADCCNCRKNFCNNNYCKCRRGNKSCTANCSCFKCDNK